MLDGRGCHHQVRMRRTAGSSVFASSPFARVLSSLGDTQGVQKRVVMARSSRDELLLARLRSNCIRHFKTVRAGGSYWASMFSVLRYETRTFHTSPGS